VTDLIFEQQRQQALVVACPYCGAEPGVACVDPRSGYVLERQIAHFQRIHARPEEVRRG
jgi:hypothetical protein